MGFFSSIFGDENTRDINKLKKTVQKVEALEPAMQKLSDHELCERHRISNNVFKTGSRLMICFLKRLQLCVRHLGACWE